MSESHVKAVDMALRNLPRGQYGYVCVILRREGAYDVSPNKVSALAQVLASTNSHAGIIELLETVLANMKAQKPPIQTSGPRG